MKTQYLYAILPLLMIAAVWLFFNSDPGSPESEPRLAVKSVTEKTQIGAHGVRSRPSARKPMSSVQKDQRAPGYPPETAMIVSPLDRDLQSRDINIEISQQIQSDELGFYTDTIRRAKEGDADAAYAYYLFLGHCTSSARTQRELDLRTIAWDETDSWGLGQADKDYLIRAAEKNFNRCSVLDPKLDLQREALDWLTLAADMGHMTAQLQYYTAARQQLLASLGVREPELFYVYHDRSRAYLQNLLKTGHPEAIFLMGVALAEGIIYEQDDRLAYAHVLLAEREGYDDPRTVFGLITQLQGRLTLREANDAKEISRELCDSICAH